MPNPHDPVSVYKLRNNWSIGAFSHRMDIWLVNVVYNAGQYAIVSRVENELLAWEDCADRLADIIAADSSSAYAQGNAELWQRNGLVWNLIDTHVPTPTPTGASFNTPGSQSTIVLRDTNLNKFKIVLMELHEAAPQHFESPTGGAAGFDALIASMVTAGGNEFDPYKYMASKYAFFVKEGGFVGCTVDLNRKVLRARGYK